MEITWRLLVKLEPGLNELYKEAKSIKPEPGKVFCANVVWYAESPGGRDMKQRLCRLVGWDRRGDGILGTSEAYDVAYDKIYSALPDCQGKCGCI